VTRVQSHPSVLCGLSLLLVLALHRGFFSGFSGFPPCTKTNISKFQFDQDRVFKLPKSFHKCTESFHFAFRRVLFFFPINNSASLSIHGGLLASLITTFGTNISYQQTVNTGVNVIVHKQCPKRDSSERTSSQINQPS